MSYSSNSSNNKRVANTRTTITKYNSSTKQYETNTITSRSISEISNSNSNSTINSSIVFPIFSLSLCLFFGSYVFSGYFHSGILNTEQIDNHEVNYLKYDLDSNQFIETSFDYQIKSLNYDWTYKLNQLESLKNVFDIDSFKFYDYDIALKDSFTFVCSDYGTNINQDNIPDSLINDSYKYYYSNKLLGQFIDDGYVIVNYDYYEKSLFGYWDKGYTYLSFSNDFLTTNDYLYNVNMLFRYVTLDNKNDYALYLKDQANYWWENLYNIAFAPLTIILNVNYDLGVLINFIVNW